MQNKPVKPQKPSLVIGNPLDCGIEGMQIFPIGMNYKPVVYDKQDRSDKEIVAYSKNIGFTSNSCSSTDFNDRHAQQEYINSNEDEFDIRNILFYDLETGNSSPLHKDTLHILSFALHNEYERPLIFYRVVKKDINRDSVYNAADAVMLFVSDLNGNNFVQCTPTNEKFIDYFYYPKTQKILVKTIIDSDDDHHFSKSDETNFREIDLANPGPGREIFQKSLKDSLRLSL